MHTGEPTRGKIPLYLVLVALIIPLVAGCSLNGATGDGRAAQPTPTAVVARSQPDTGTAPLKQQQTEPTAVAAAPTAQPVLSPAAEGGATVAPASTAPAELTVLVEEVQPAVVQIISESATSPGTGSGFVFDDDGHILTNNHVVEGGNRISVIFSDGRIARARLVGTDRLTDIAVLQVQLRDLPKVRLGDATKLRVGEPVFAIGSALGLAVPTVTTGVVSALERTEQEPPSGNRPGALLNDLIQTDTAINPGNSGGPLLNLRGEVVGINTLGQRQTQSGVPVQGINYAVSINTARDVSAEILQNGEVTYPFIGVVATFLSAQRSVLEDLPNVRGQHIDTDPRTGATFTTPAIKAGLRQGDIITAIDDQPIDDESAFLRILRQFDPGDEVTLSIRRGERSIDVPLTLVERRATE